MTVEQILVSLGLPLAFGIVPWVLTAVRTGMAAAAVAAGLAFAVTASVTGGAPRAVSDFVLLVVAVGGGVALGRVLSLKPQIMTIFLALASIADFAQNELFGGTGSGTPGGPGTAAATWPAYTVLRIPLPGGRYDIGPLDLLLFAAIGEHWRRRRGSLVHSAAPGVLGMALVDLAPWRGSLPLVPFVFGGWLLTEAAARLARPGPHGTRRLRLRRAPPAS
jgi:hypothetical protein